MTFKHSTFYSVVHETVKVLFCAVLLGLPKKYYLVEGSQASRVCPFSKSNV